MIDSWGFVGLILDYGMIIFFSLGSIACFLYFWKKGQLNFDEAAKFEMLHEEHERVKRHER